MNHPLSKIFKNGPVEIARSVLVGARCIYHGFRTRTAPGYSNPTDSELEEIERRIEDFGMPCRDLVAEVKEFTEFVQQINFPPTYHGGIKGGVYYEKLLEHFVAGKLLRLDDSFHAPYVDIAAC